MLHGCTIGNRVLVGMGSILLDGVVVEDDVMIGAGSLVPQNKRLESGYLYFGNPVKQIRPLTGGAGRSAIFSKQLCEMEK
jgi:carbonic anhydrase/acetyltransferase-like protein (isoleucine patch superfamily)